MGRMGFVVAAMWVSVSRLPEVGDLLLSMSMDCWLSESSVRPVADNGSQEEEEVEGAQSIRLFRSHRLNRSQLNWCQPHRAPRKRTVYQQCLSSLISCIAISQYFIIISEHMILWGSRPLLVLTFALCLGFCLGFCRIHFVLWEQGDWLLMWLALLSIQ